MATPTLVERAAAFAECDGVVRVRSATELFHTACLAICVFSEAIDPNLKTDVANPLNELNVMNRIILLVENLYGQDDEFWAPYCCDC
jgi:hypothetical protein